MLTAYGEPYTLRKVSTVLREGKQETSPKGHWRLNPYSTTTSRADHHLSFQWATIHKIGYLYRLYEQ